MTNAPQPPTDRKRKALIVGAAVVTALAIGGASYAAGRAGSNPAAPAAKPSPTYTTVALDVMCENVNSSAVAADGRTLTCIYNQGRATWTVSPSPSPSPTTSSPAAVATTKAAPPPPPPPPTIDEGTWTVGVDVPAGTYRVTEPVSGDCYWAILKSGTNGDTIISNDIPGGGRPTVVLKKGQDFESSSCGTWRKTK